MLNLVVAAVLTLVLAALKVPEARTPPRPTTTWPRPCDTGVEELDLGERAADTPLR